MDKKILEIKDLKKKYPGGFSLDINSLSIKENRILVLIGPNGSGKSTLIRLINLLEDAGSGQIFLDGEEILSSNSRDKVIYRKKMSAVFQEPLLYNMPVYNNIILGLQFRKINMRQKKDIFGYLVEKLNLAGLLDRNPKSLSGGEQQRVSLARALIIEPRLLLLDEPLANIDQLSRETLREKLFGILKDIGRSAI